MKILVLSDTHGTLFEAKRAIDKNPDIDVILHLGDYIKDAKKLASLYPDKKFEYIPGNCDFIISESAAEKTLEYEGKRILMTHGHRHSVKTSPEKLCNLAEEKQIDLLLFGHTHVAEIIQKPGYILLNPGSISLPRGTADKSCALVEICGDEIKARIVFM